MKAIVNYPTDKEMVKELHRRVAHFHATLVVETIKRLNIDDFSKEKVLNGVLEKLKNEIEQEKVLDS